MLHPAAASQSPFRLAFVSNSSAIAHAVQNYAAARGLHVDIRLASMEHAVPVARELLAKGTEVILGGGGTGKLLRQKLQRPVVTIARSYLDVIRALREARQHGNNLALTCYNTAPQGMDIIEELLDIRLRPIVFDTTQALRSGIARAAREGAQCIVGGGICAQIAHSLHCPSVIVTPGEEVMQRALEEALNIAMAQRQEGERVAWLSGILESLHEGIVGVNAEGAVITCNKRATELLERDLQNEGTSAAPILRTLELSRALTAHFAIKKDELRHIGKHDFIVNAHPIVVDNKVCGAVSAFRPAADIRHMDGKLKEHLRRRGFTTRHSMENLAGNSPLMKHLREKALRFARTEAAVLIQGETGTGKELLAHSIHNASLRAQKPFVAVNCAALPDSLLESELFGHDEGAFTGARRGGKDGLFTLADGGSIFLDEIGDISPAMQALLLRVLESGEIMRVGGDRVISVNVRVISSSWKNLAQEVRDGRLRADLYYRLTPLCLHLPPLRQRREDIPDIVHALLRKHQLSADCLSAHGLALLAACPWPGNIRELEAVLRRYVLLLDSPQPDDALLEELLAEDASRISPLWAEQPNPPATQGLKAQLEAREKEILRQTLRFTGGNKVEAARLLDISANTLWRKLKGLPEGPANN